VPKAIQELQVPKVPKAIQELQVPKVPKAIQELQVPKVLKVIQVPLVLKVLRVIQVPLVLLVLLDQLAHKVPREHQDLLVTFQYLTTLKLPRRILTIILLETIPHSTLLPSTQIHL
jgi:hypothetical protein